MSHGKLTYIIQYPQNLYKALPTLALIGVVEKFLCIYKYNYNILNLRVGNLL